MRRAIVHFLWGARHLNEVIESAKHSIDVGVPRIAIMDMATAGLVPEPSPFEQVVTVDVRLPTLITKATMYSHLPPQYESFLFLDTDTHILGDVAYGFQQAELFGIAAVMAPH